MNKVGYILAFTFGAAAGSLLTWKLVEEKYKQIADEEIESVKERYRQRDKELDPVRTGYCGVTGESITVGKYEKQVKDLGYSAEIEEVYIEPGMEHIEPYVITPDEFGEKDYKTESWTYYSDLVLTDENDEVVSNYESIIGDALTHFGEYEDDSVFVRNENIECDYEILKVMKPFSEINEEE